MTENVLLTGTVLPNSAVEKEIVEDAGGSLTTIDVSSTAELIDAATDPVGIMTIETDIDESVMDAFPNLEFISVHGIGVDMVDLDAATERGIPVFNTPHYCLEEVATHTLSLILACQRRVCQFNSDVKAGGWDYESEGPIRRLSSKTVGVVGCGDIGLEVVKRLTGFDVDILGYDPYVSEAELSHHGIRKADFETLCENSDIITVHTPLTESTRQLIDAAAFESMGEGVTLVNAARGEIVDQDALSEAVERGTVAYAGLDVLQEEPPEDDRLLNFDNVVVTPHAAWYSEDALAELQRQAGENVAAFIRGERPDYVVNESVLEQPRTGQ
ncbi:C-terminal binding protein [Halobellus ruber]|uniref:C-terminal binding protein n=1 Tax=Halobellus ruber TaxID=2761102 RepID=A0A7J9SHX5_9EURY|nr:C-terminal binding protein [Halobellus ruber]MBB6646570.1 C-terminal binding protein [Halobellus ruber]